MEHSSWSVAGSRISFLMKCSESPHAEGFLSSTTTCSSLISEECFIFISGSFDLLFDFGVPSILNMKTSNCEVADRVKTSWSPSARLLETTKAFHPPLNTNSGTTRC
ncbi:hypothetical protein KC19_4G256100 [Ceratodon purpureus]|uniref:Uncharacterized protein n=1 Tax=Ceratodon purpureus TaxID=3225 RepID=A0A8T0IF73_CERPU|nr:hypothetical protein KC19_4G256100 [Ceratodon purpureus]